MFATPVYPRHSRLSKLRCSKNQNNSVYTDPSLLIAVTAKADAEHVSVGAGAVTLYGRKQQGGLR